MSGTRRFALLAILDALLGLLVVGLALALMAMWLFTALTGASEVLTPSPDGARAASQAWGMTTVLGIATAAVWVLQLLADAVLVVLCVLRLRRGSPARPAAVLALVAVAAGSALPLVLIGVTVGTSALAQGPFPLWGVLATLLALLVVAPVMRLVQLAAAVPALSAEGRTAAATGG